MGSDNDKKKSSALQNLGVVVGWYIFNIGRCSAEVVKEREREGWHGLFCSYHFGKLNLASGFPSKQGLLS